MVNASQHLHNKGDEVLVHFLQRLFVLFLPCRNRTISLSSLLLVPVLHNDAFLCLIADICPLHKSWEAFFFVLCYSFQSIISYFP